MTYIEQPVKILDQKDQVLRNKVIPLMRLRNRLGNTPQRCKRSIRSCLILEVRVWGQTPFKGGECNILSRKIIFSLNIHTSLYIDNVVGYIMHIFCMIEMVRVSRGFTGAMWGILVILEYYFGVGPTGVRIAF